MRPVKIPIAQADPNLRGAHMSEGTFSDYVTHRSYPFMRVDSDLDTLDRFICNRSRRSVWLVLSLLYFIEIPVSNANSMDSDQTPRYAASDLGLHCLPVSLLWNARHKWVNQDGPQSRSTSFSRHQKKQ